MADNEVENAGEEELLDYDEEVQETAAEGSGEGEQKKDVKGTYVSIHSSGFRDFLLKPELLRAIVDCGFEHPSEGKDVLICILNEIYRSGILYIIFGDAEVHGPRGRERN